jgi:chemotaxis protein methyltransferase CheR
MKELLPISADDSSLFRNLILETSGLQFEEDRKQSLHLALGRRLEQRGYGSYREYYNLLKFHPEGPIEMKELLDLLTVGETAFFRNKAQFHVLMRFVLPELIRRKSELGEKRLRAWSAGCSRGNEPYSIAIALLEVLPSYKDWNLSILGTDIHRDGLACAKQGVYCERDISFLPKAYLEKYFKVQGTTYLLHPEVRGLVQFEYHNLVKDSCRQATMQDLDLVFCRNVTIYFDARTTRRVIDKIHDCLSPGGYLFLGHTETLWRLNDQFENVEFPQAFVYRKKPDQDDSRRHGDPLQAGKEAEACSYPTTPPVAERESKQGTFSTSGEGIPALLTHATTLANQARYKEAADVLEKIIKADNLSVDAYYLLGTLCSRSGDLREAEAHFRRAIYVNPESVLAYYQLGSLYLSQRRFEQAAREFNNAVRLSERRRGEQQETLEGAVTMDCLLAACRNHLAAISKRGG